MADTDAIYERAGMANRFQWGDRPAVVVVDFGGGFTDPGSPLGAEMSAEVQATRQLLDSARARGIPIIFTVIALDPDAGMNVWADKIPTLRQLAPGSAWAELDPRLGREPHEPVLVKQYASAFFATSLASMLAAAQVNTVLFAGATTSGCIRASVVDAVQHGFPPIVVRDCVADRAEGPHEANLFDIQAKYGDVVALQQAMDYLHNLQ